MSGGGHGATTTMVFLFVTTLNRLAIMFTGMVTIFGTVNNMPLSGSTGCMTAKTDAPS